MYRGTDRKRNAARKSETLLKTGGNVGLRSLSFNPSWYSYALTRALAALDSEVGEPMIFPEPSACTVFHQLRRVSRLRFNYFAELYNRGDVRVVGDVRPNLRAMRVQCLKKRLQRL